MKTILALASLAAFSALAESQFGAWNDEFSNSLAKAESENVPIVVIWGNQSCHYCNQLHEVLENPGVLSFMENHPALYVSLHVPYKGEEYLNPDSDYNQAKAWIATIDPTLGENPRVAVWWKKSDGTVVEQAFAGRTGMMPTKKPAGNLAGQFVASLEQLIGGYQEGVKFGAGNTAADRLEATERTFWVEVPFRREVVNVETQTELSVVFPDAVPERRTLLWSKGEGLKYVQVDLAGRFAAGESVALILPNEPEAPESAISFVEDPGNNPKNPFWLGERTLSTLAAGEWTMDFDLVKARAKARNRPALVLIGGSLWCPDCVKTDHYLIDTPEFGKWLKDNDISCAAIDVPNAPSQKNTFLLTYEATSTSDRYVNATVPPQERIQSGSGYLSRHMIRQTGNGGTNATAIAARNLRLLNEDTEHGGLCRPENMGSDNTETGPFKTGIPCLILLRPDGTVSGRLYQFNNVSPGDTTALPAYLARMDELVALCAEPAEEDNADWRTTKTTIGLAETRSASISAMDLADFYRLQPVDFTLEGALSVKAKAVPAGASLVENNVRLSLVEISASSNVVSTQTATGNVFAGLTLPVRCSKTGSSWYVSVKAIATSATFLMEHEGDSTVAYDLTAAVSPQAPVLGFEKAEATVSEATAGLATVKVRRGGGISGRVSAKVRLNAAATTATSGTYVWEDTIVTWEDGDREPKDVSILVSDDGVWDGDRQIVLELAELAGEAVAPTVSQATFALKVREDDKPVVGKLAIVGTTPALAKGMTVVARAGSVIGLAVERVDGASGVVTGELSAAAGELASNRLVWVHNDRVTLKATDLKVPDLTDLGPMSSFKVDLKGIGLPVVTMKKTLQVQVVADDAPGFTAAGKTYFSRRYVAFEDTVGINNWHGGKLSLMRTSGSLPSGITAKVVTDGEAAWLVVSGVPTVAKTYEAVYQIREMRTFGKSRRQVPGTTIRIVFEVGELAVTDRTGGEPVNPAVAKSRSFTDLPVINAGSGSLAGLLNVTIPQNGRLSAKYRGSEGSVSLSCTRWSACDEGTGALTAELTVARKPYRLVVTARRDGSVGYALAGDPALAETVYGEWRGEAWSRTNPATRWAGYYTVDCPVRSVCPELSEFVPSGDAFFTAKMNTTSAVNAGRMTYAGRLPDGTAFSGSSVLTAKGEDVWAPVCYRSSSNFFTALASVGADAAQAYRVDDEHRTVVAATGISPCWRHKDARMPELNFDVVYDLYGAYYDAKEDISLCASAKFEGVQLAFSAADGEIVIPVTLTEKSVKLDTAAGNPHKVTLSFVRSTGLVSGSFRWVPPGAAKEVTVSYNGILLPGWGGCGECQPGEVFRPLACGAFRYSQQYGYEKKSGSRTVTSRFSYQRGAAISIGEIPGD